MALAIGGMAVGTDLNSYPEFAGGAREKSPKWPGHSGLP